jgi:Cu-Zn family superoxide dismutase
MKQVISALYRSAIGLLLLTIVSCNNTNETSNSTEDTSKIKADHTETAKVVDTPPPPAMPDTSPVVKVSHAQAILQPSFPDTAVTGTINFDTLKMGKVKMKLDITIPSKAGKTVAVHIHEHGDCSNKGEMAHGHWNPTKSQHGKWDSGEFHLGDIGNVKLDSKGRGQLTIETSLWSLGGSWSKNIVGKSIIIHGGTDDYKTQPSGNSGARIGCGVIQ